MNDITSPDNHFESNDVQRLIRSYRSCPSITNNGTACRSSLTTNKFMDPVTGNKWNCNYYCIRQCAPEKLVHIFKNRPREIITTRGDRLNVGMMEITFFSETNFDNVEFTFESVIDDSKDSSSANDTANEMSSRLCKWIKSIPSNETICVFVTVAPDSDDMKRFRSFSRFDIPYLRPANEWDKLSTNVTIEFKLVDPASISKTRTSCKKKSHSASREQLQLFPIERSRRSEPLVYHGIAHPDIHRISRKNRPESHYRPRHFHSPRRQTSVGKQTRK